MSWRRTPQGSARWLPRRHRVHSCSGPAYAASPNFHADWCLFGICLARGGGNSIGIVLARPSVVRYLSAFGRFLVSGFRYRFSGLEKDEIWKSELEVPFLCYYSEQCKYISVWSPIFEALGYTVRSKMLNHGILLGSGNISLGCSGWESCLWGPGENGHFLACQFARWKLWIACFFSYRCVLTVSKANFCFITEIAFFPLTRKRY